MLGSRDRRGRDAGGCMLTRRTFFGAATAVAASAFASGMPRWSDAKRPRLKVGIISDVHLLTANDRHWHSGEMFEKALRYFDGKCVDAVLLCGDIADCGLVAELELAADIWNKVFPNGRRRDGECVRQLFHLGDHDLGGFAHKYYWAKECSRSLDELNHVIAQEDVAAIWERLFGEMWTPIQVKNIKGYTFVLAHHPLNVAENIIAGTKMPGTEIPNLAKALADVKVDPSKPFFYSQHRPIYGTLPDFPQASLDADPNYRALAAYPNVLAFFGHTHRNCADELSLWQGTFTSVCVPSTNYYTTRMGRENSFAVGRSRVCQMQRTEVHETRQLLNMEVFRDRITLSRRDLTNDATMGADWVIPLPVTDGTCSMTVRKSRSVAPKFPDGAVAKVSSGIGMDRGKNTRPEVVVSFPPAHAVDGHPRAFDYEVLVTVKGQVKMVRRVFSTRPCWCDDRDVAPVRCVFAFSELPPDQQISFTVTPFNSYGIAGCPLPPVFWMKGHT